MKKEVQVEYSFADLFFNLLIFFISDLLPKVVFL